MADFCELSHRVDFNDVTLKDIFRFDIDKPLRSSLPGGKICWSLERYIDGFVAGWFTVYCGSCG